MLQPTLWSCLPTSFGMVLEYTPKEMFERIGHDGSEIIAPEQPEPRNRRWFHPQECVDIAVACFRFPVAIEPRPVSCNEDGSNVFELPFNGERVAFYLQRPCVLVGQTKTGKNHAVAWCPKEMRIFDPDGFKCDFDEFTSNLIFSFF